MNKVIPLTPDWKSAFQQMTMRTNFELRLSQSMIEYLSATADDAHWDRVRHQTSRQDTFIATSTALEKKGLIVRKSQEEILKESKDYDAKCPENRGPFFWDRPCCYRLTPAGESLVNLFKVVGIFVETEAAINRRKRKG